MLGTTNLVPTHCLLQRRSSGKSTGSATDLGIKSFDDIVRQKPNKGGGAVGNNKEARSVRVTAAKSGTFDLMRRARELAFGV